MKQHVDEDVALPAKPAGCTHGAVLPICGRLEDAPCGGDTATPASETGEDGADPDTPAGRDYRAAFEALKGKGGVSFSAVARNAGLKGRSPVPLISRNSRFKRLRRDIQDEIDRQEEARREAKAQALRTKVELEAARDPEEVRYEGRVRALSNRLRAADSLNMAYKARTLRAEKRVGTARRRYERIRTELAKSEGGSVPPAFDDLAESDDEA